MKFIVSSSELQKYMTKISGVVPSKSVVPICQGNILFEVIDGRLQLSGTDLSMSMQTSLPVEVEESGNFNLVLPYKNISDTLKLLPEQPVIFISDDVNKTVKMITDNGEFVNTSSSGADFPKVKFDSSANSINLSVEILISAIEKTIFAASTEEMKHTLNGVYFNFQSDYSTFVATDAHRLVRYRRTDVSSAQSHSFIIPIKALKVVLNLCNSLDEPFVNIEFNERQAVFYLGDCTLSCRLVDGRYPDYETVIPGSSPNRVIMNRKDLLTSMKRLDNYASKATHLGRFQFKGNFLTIFSEDVELASHAKENLTCLYDGEEIEIGFNINLMLDVINSIPTEEVILELGAATRVAVVLPSEQEANENNLMLLMPVIIGGGY